MPTSPASSFSPTGLSTAEAAARLRARVDQGKLEATARPLDLAIAGDGLFRVRDGDRFHVRYEQTFTATGIPIGTGRVLWAELQLLDLVLRDVDFDAQEGHQHFAED